MSALGQTRSSSTPQRLTGRVAVVTAAGSGIGRASAERLAAEGAHILVTDIYESAAAAVADEIRASGGRAESLAVDVEQPDAIRNMVEVATARFGGVDILHNNAALLDVDYGARDRSLLTLDVEAWDRILAVNLRSVMLGCQAAIPNMIARGGGVIVNTASTLGLRGDIQLPAYSASKAAIIGLTRQIATEFGKQRIRCNAIAPAVIRTPTVVRFLPQELLLLNEEASLTPSIGEPEDVGAVVAFLASDDARFITGHVIPVDGGATAHLPTAAGYRAHQQRAEEKL